MDPARLPSPPESLQKRWTRRADAAPASHRQSGLVSPQLSINYSTPILKPRVPRISTWQPTEAAKVQVPPLAHRRWKSEQQRCRGVYSFHEEMQTPICIGAIVDPDPELEHHEWHPRPTANDRRVGTSFHIISRSGTVTNADADGGLLDKTIPFMWLEQGICELPTGEERAPVDVESTKHPEKPSKFFSAYEALFIFNVCLAQFMSLAGLAQTYAPLMVLSKAFGVSNPGIMAWPTAAYSLTLGSCILPAGRLGDMYGHKKIFVIGWLWFGFSSLLCGFSLLGGTRMLTATRALQGVGPALLVPNGLALFGRRFPIGMKRNIAISLFGGCGPLGVVTGAVFSSLFSTYVWWPWQFWTMGFVCLVIAALTLIIIKSEVKDPSTIGKPRETFDVQGALTGVGGLVLINFVLNQTPIDGWTKPYLLILLVFGVLLIGTFVYVELCISVHPLIPLRGLRADGVLTLMCVAAGWSSHGIWLYYMFLLMERVREVSALGACAMFWPVAPIGLTAALAVGFILKRIRVAYLLSAAMLFFLAGCLLLATAPARQTYFANTLVSVIITPLGMNWSFPTAVILMSNAVPKEKQGIAASLVATMINYSISTGLGFAGSVDRHVTPVYGVLAGYRAAWFMGVGLSGLGLVISLYFIWRTRTRT